MKEILNLIEVTSGNVSQVTSFVIFPEKGTEAKKEIIRKAHEEFLIRIKAHTEIFTKADEEEAIENSIWDNKAGYEVSLLWSSDIEESKNEETIVLTKNELAHLIWDTRSFWHNSAYTTLPYKYLRPIFWNWIFNFIKENIKKCTSS